LKGSLPIIIGIMKPRLYKNLLRVLYILSIAVYIYFLTDGWSFYETPYQERPHMEQRYRNLRPAGFRGHTFGVIGSLMMIFMLLYSARKRMERFQKAGNLSHWLDIHIFFGIMGPLLIVLHTSFKVQGLVAVSFWSMVAVALSGVFGRYLYIQIPRNILGNELSTDELEKINKEMADRLKTDFNLDDELLSIVEESAAPRLAPDAGIAKMLLLLLVNDLSLRFGLRKIPADLAARLEMPPKLLHLLWRRARQRGLLRMRTMLANQVHQLFHYWHVVHKPFAVIMYVIMVIHIAVDVLMGYRWIF